MGSREHLRPEAAWHDEERWRPTVDPQPTVLPDEGDCEWAEGYGIASLDAPALAMTTFDDGTGEALYVGGTFTTAGGVMVNYIAKWDGAAWSALGTGVDDAVRALAVFDDGTGPALYAGGLFTTAGGVAADYIAKWDGSVWSAVDTGVDDAVLSLAVFDDGSGAQLYAGGAFTTAGGVPVNYIAKWNGTIWSEVDANGMDNTVAALTVFDDGDGAALYAGGFFDNAGGNLVNYIAKWDGAVWSDLDTGVNNAVLALTVFDDGSSAQLIAGGRFGQVGSSPLDATLIASWDGVQWSALGLGLSDYYYYYYYDEVNALAAFDDGSGEALYAGGSFDTAGGMEANNIARWDGAAWSALGTGTNASVEALGTFDDGTGEKLYAGGSFRDAGGIGAAGIASWDGTDWGDLNVEDAHGVDDVVFALAVFDDGTGEALYAGGIFLTAGGVLAPGIARWDGSAWAPLGSGVACVESMEEGPPPRSTSPPAGTSSDATAKGVMPRPRRGCDDPSVEALVVFDDGTGPALYVGGVFDEAGGVAASNIARWDGTSWSALDEGTDDRVEALAVFDDGTGAALFVGGEFDFAGPIYATHIARWDGAGWSDVGGGTDDDVETLAVFDDGTGDALYAGGEMTDAGGVSADYIARWDGLSWSAVGSGLDNEVEALAVFDDGTGDALYATGAFNYADGALADYIARWDGTAWSAVGGGLNDSGEAFAVYDDGDGPALYVGGFFTTAGGIPASRIASWNGTIWSPLGLGIDDPSIVPDYYEGTPPISVEALGVFDDGSGASLFAGGSFTTAGGLEATNIAEWRCTLLDYGDAPDTYGTLFESDGARHDAVDGFHLGPVIDAELDGQPTADATGDEANGADEDGVTFLQALVQGADVLVEVDASAAGVLDAWVDWNADGDFDDAGEKALDGIGLAPGPYALTLSVPASATAGDTFARFRFSSAGVADPTGRAPDGEVEDYMVAIEEPPELSIDDVTLVEGTGAPTDFTFTVTRSHNLNAVSVDVASADGSAMAGEDYTALPLQTLSFAAGGDLTQTVTVQVIGDALEEEATEDFFVNLSNPSVATLADDQGIGTITDDDDTGPPAVTNIDSVNGTGDGMLEECEEARVGVRQLLVTFDQAVRDPEGDEAADDVTNPDNYRLFAAGPDNDLSSNLCAAPAGDDLEVGIGVVTYDEATFTATVELADGAVLESAPYRLVVCEEISDLAGNPLDGGDFPRAFRVETENLFVNGQLDCDLEGWTLEGGAGEIGYAAEDVDGASISGSAQLGPAPSGPLSLSQCVAVQGGLSYTLGGAVQLSAAAEVQAFLTRSCSFFSAAECAGEEALPGATDVFVVEDTAAAWERLETEITAPEEAVSALCSFQMSAPGGEAFDARLDDLRMSTPPLLFVDGFESGDTTAWSSTSP